MTKRTRVLTTTGAFRAWWSLAIVLVVAVLITSGNVIYTNHVQRQADRRHAEQQAQEERAQQEARRQGLRAVCAWLELRVEPEPPPSTARGRGQLLADQRLYEQFGCKGAQ